MRPSNILLNEYSNLKLCDFGLAKKIEEFATGEADSGKAKTGTPYYMAPELFSDGGVYSYFSDFWALGCVLYELASGKPPFYSTSLKDLIKMIVDINQPALPDFSPQFNDLVKKLLEKDPIKRINWDELKAHPFWEDNKATFTKRGYPAQPQFDKYLLSRGIVPEHYYDLRNNPLAKKFGAPSSGKVDILRLSHNVRKNVRRQEEEESND